MRELKFRAWKMHYGKLRRYVCSPFGLSNYAQRHPDAPVMHYQNINDIRDFMPDADVIEQYTGLKDKNGKEIYDGDIVKYSAYGENYIGQVAFSFVYDSEGYYIDKHYGWGIYRNDSSLEDFADDSLGDSADENMLCEGVEVIGNIHENPELIKEKEWSN